MKISVVSAVAALVISFSASHYHQVKEYVACDVQQRMPAVKMRFFYAKQKINEVLETMEEER